MNKKSTLFQRRDFLKKSLQGMSTIGMLTLGNTLLFARNENKTKSGRSAKQKIICRTLGKTGIKVPVVNMGVMNANSPELLKQSYKKGVRHFDTAAWYQRGKNEEMVGKVMKELNIRDKVIIGTKIFLPEKQRNISYEKKVGYFKKVMAESLKRLQTPYVDILYVHSVSKPEFLSDPAIAKVMKEFKNEKKARFIGFTTHANMANVINHGVKMNFYDVVEVAFNYSMHQNFDLINSLQNAARKGLGLVAMKTQCQQPWYKQHYEPKASQIFYDDKIIHTALLKWVLNHPFITTAIPGYNSFRELEEDFSVAYSMAYTLEEKKFLKDKNIRVALSAVCQQCSYCVTTCTKRVDIPTLMRTHMYATCYNNFHQAKITLKEIPAQKGLANCSGCRSCRATCRQAVNIGQRIEELKQIYS